MKRWLAAKEVSKVFAVGTPQLFAFSRRGNLPSRFDHDGTRLFDTQAIAALFPRRISPLLAWKQRNRDRPLGDISDNMGKLDEVALGKLNQP